MKVALVGGAPRTKDLAPYNDPEWEIWALGVHLDLPRITRIFEIHPEYLFETDDYPQRLVDLNIPLVVHENFPFRNENIEVFDRDQVTFGKLTSSISYMMAYAIMNGVTHIKIFGVDMDVDDKEYFEQRPGLYAWLGYAEGLGIKVEIPESSLYNDMDYPYSKKGIKPYTENEFRKMASYHQEMMNKYTQEIEQLKTLYHTHDGCRQVYERLAKIGRATDAGIEVEQIDHSTVIRR